MNVFQFKWSVDYHKPLIFILCIHCSNVRSVCKPWSIQVHARGGGTMVF